MDKVQRSQSEEYRFPYHYIPSIAPDLKSFSAIKRWDFSESYILATMLARDWIIRNNLGSGRHLDIGCGDGGFVQILRNYFSALEISGIDYDARAIGWAKAFSPQENFVCGDITREDILSENNWRPFDSASLVEVIEHIPPNELSEFMRGVERCISPGGRLFVTVPHKNKPLEEKHYRHFDFKTLADSIGTGFVCERMLGFESRSLPKRIVRRALQNRIIFIESPVLAGISLRNELKIIGPTERLCGRIAAEFVRL